MSDLKTFLECVEKYITAPLVWTYNQNMWLNTIINSLGVNKKNNIVVFVPSFHAKHRIGFQISSNIKKQIFSHFSKKERIKTTVISKFYGTTVEISYGLI